MARERVLVVDDEQFNLLIIEEFLAAEDLSLELHADPLLAWDALHAADSDFALVLLDRMMPGLDGIDFLRRMKAESRFSSVPVIMQTVASSLEQVRQGHAAGAYYYLTKPYTPEALVSIVRAALDDRCRCLQLLDRSVLLEEAQTLLCGVEYRFVTLEDVSCLVPILAALCSNPDAVASGLADLMVNAVEHGNLGISYREKSRLKKSGDWAGEITKRLALAPYAGRSASIRAERTTEGMVFTITDQGEGFDWEKYIDFDPDRAFDLNGRGIALARLISFSSLTYRGKGNVVVAIAGAEGASTSQRPGC
jgi:CheY-like chemotaxis protein